jgi:uncharacterized hydrophobic protein (TIGR00271 family)
MKVSKNLRLLATTREFIRDRFNLDEDKADELQTIENLKKGIEFRGTNLWVLIFAIIVASVGLNVNSTAVIIGAMLISPLMGPIMGIGLGVGINDFELIKRAFKNLAVAAGISILTSALYFFISPLGEAQSELLSRTTPAIWDVLIALFGGLAGIVAASRKHFSNVIPGVAIATALMPPLCTAGYGLASGNLSFFVGAFFLFFINSVFISFATLIIVRFLKYPQKEFMDPATEKKVKRYILIIILITVVPSIIMAYNIVHRSIFERNANAFINNELIFRNTHILSKNILLREGKKIIEVFMVGEKLDDKTIDLAKQKLEKYGMEDTDLMINQGASVEEKFDLSYIRTGLIEDLYKKNEELLKSKEKRIEFLENELAKASLARYPVDEIYNEAKAQYSNLSQFFIDRVVVAGSKIDVLDTVTVAYAKFTSKPASSEIKRLEKWLAARTKTDKLKLIVQ